MKNLMAALWPNNRFDLFVFSLEREKIESLYSFTSCPSR